VGLVAITPLLVVYELAILVDPDHGQATAGLLVRRVFDVLGPGGFLVFNAALAIGFLLALRAKHRDRSTRRFHLYPAILLEGAVYGGLLGPLLVRLLGRLVPMSSGTSAALPVALAAGAAVYEEILFRLVLVGGGLALLRGARGLDRSLTAVLLVLVSSALFSLFHHVGPGAEPFAIGVATYRFCAGLVLAGLFVLRGLGVTAYTHAAYNAAVMVT
jgi:hypothetical protein